MPLNTEQNQSEKNRSIRVMHFVTGGFSGSTSVAIELVKATLNSDQILSTLVLRKKSSTPFDRIEKLRAQNINVELVTGWLHIATIIALVKLFKKHTPDVVVCHGFSEHLWGRYAGLIAKVPHLIHVEHNSRERYTAWRLMQARWLAKFTDKLIGCSSVVSNRLKELKFPEQKILAINNGIDLTPYTKAPLIPFADRPANIVMPARFAKQKDHLTLIQAVALLRDKGFTPHVYLAGSGNQKHMDAAKQLTANLQLDAQIHFLGFCTRVPELLMENKICVLSTRYEGGMVLALCEGMAAGCAVVATEVTGVKEMLRHNVDGVLVAPDSAESMASALEKILTDTNFAEQLAQQANLRAMREFSVKKMSDAYEDVFLSLTGKQSISTEIHP